MATPSCKRRDLIRLLSTAIISPVASPALSLTPPSSGQDNAPIYVPNGTGERLKIGGGRMTFKLQKAQTHGHLAVAEATLAPGFLGAPPHLHRTFDEICFVLEGSVQVLVGDRVFDLKAGDLHLRPRGVMHTFWNSSRQPSKCLEFSIPGGHEEYLKDISLLLSKGVSPKPEDFAELEKRHDIVYFPNKLPELMQKYHVHL